MYWLVFYLLVGCVLADQWHNRDQIERMCRPTWLWLALGWGVIIIACALLFLGVASLFALLALANNIFKLGQNDG